MRDGLTDMIEFLNYLFWARSMYQAVMAFENDSIDLAINGNEKFDGLLTIVDQYGSTAAIFFLSFNYFLSSTQFLLYRIE